MPTAPNLNCMYLKHRPSLLRYVAGSFPRLCFGRVEDAVSDTFTIACSNPDLLLNAFAQGGEKQVAALLRVIAWRCARAVACRGAWAREQSVENELLERGRRSDQEYLVDLRLHLPGAVLEAARKVLPSAPDRLAEAVMDRLVGGETDGEVAARFGMRREYVNQARRLVEGSVAAQMA